MPRHRGIWGEQWSKCGRCWFTYPLGHLTMQLGLLVCPKCIDDISNMARPAQIAEMLSTTEETESQYTHIADDPGLNPLEF